MDAATLQARLGPLVEREGGGPADWAERLSAYLARLVEHNAHVNLVSRRSIDRVVEDHVLPSLAVLRLAPPGDGARHLDVGSGGGFPAIPLKILRPMVRLDLVEATRKKCEFLEAELSAQGWREDRVHWGRVEAPPEALRERGPFDRATARAVGDHARLARVVPRLLRDGGRLWIFVAPEGEMVGDDLVWTDREGRAVTALRPLG